MKDKLQSVLDRINEIAIAGEEDVIRNYRSLLNEAINLLEQGGKELDGMSAIWAQMALQEMKGEINHRMGEQIFLQDVSKRKTELSYSKTMVSMALMNVRMNL
jgi:hypothetical protein